MRYRLTTLTFATLVLAASVQAQGLRLTDGPSLGRASQASVAPLTQADFIAAVVNSEPITNNEVQREMARVRQQLAAQQRAPLDQAGLAAEVLESLINRKVQLQVARETGIRVEDAAVDQAEQSVASQNQIDQDELTRRLAREGMTRAQFREQLREQIMLQRLRERDLAARVQVTEQDIDQYLKEQQGGQRLSDLQLNLAQVLVAVPESATPEQVAALEQRAQQVAQRARAGENFSALAREFSDAPERADGGQLGLRAADRYPPLFVQATASLSVGDVAASVRSPAGFHVLKVIEKVNTALPAATLTQSHARHILLLPSAKLSAAEAKRRLEDFRQQVLSGKADFAALARANSQDGSAAQGGDLGWANPGMFVPEFEDTMNHLAPGEISEPLQSRFGVHLIQLLERRRVALSPQQQRESVRAMLREKKLDEAYQPWVQELRGRAYVEMRESPQ